MSGVAFMKGPTVYGLGCIYSLDWNTGMEMHALCFSVNIYSNCHQRMLDSASTKFFLHIMHDIRTGPQLVMQCNNLS